MGNKVKYNLKNVHAAVLTESVVDGETVFSYGTPKAIPGAVSIALVMGCRPQLAIAVLFAFPIFWRQIREGLFFTAKGLKNLD